MTVAFSVGRNARHADKLEQVRGTFDDLVQRVQPNGCAKKDGPYICGPLRDGRRNTESAEPIAFIALDLDKIPDEVALARIVEAAEHWQGVGYTTFSHRPEAGIHKARLIFATDRAVTRAEYPRLCRAVADGLAQVAGAPVEIDESCSKPEQPLYTARQGAIVWQFNGEPIRVDQALLRVPEAPERPSPLEGLKSSDPVLLALRDRGRILRDMGGGKFAIRCPFEAEHSRVHTADDSSTVYMLPFTGGFQHGHFVCQHAHCAGRSTDDFRAALGFPTVQPPRTTAGDGRAGETPAEWPDPILPGHVRPPEIPANLLPSWIASMVQSVAASTQTPTAIGVLCALGVLATAMHRRFEVAPWDDSYTEPLSLWGLSASPSGTRKSGVMVPMIGPLVRWEKHMRDRMRGEIARVASARDVAKKRIERLLQDAARAKDDIERENVRAEIQREHEGMPDEVRAPRLFTGDTTPERLQQLLVEHGERMGLHSDEPGIFQVMAGMYSGGNANLDAFLQAYSGTAIRVDRAGRLAHVDRPALTMNLMVQPDLLAEVAGSKRFRGSGLLARFVYVVPESNVGRRDVRQRVAIPDAVADEYERRLFTLLEDRVAPVTAPRVLAFSTQARDAWLDLSEDVEREQGHGGRFESISDWTSKLPGATARIAGLLELAEHGVDVQEIGLQAIERAVALARLLIPHAQVAFGLLGTDSTDVDAQHVLRWIQANDLHEFTRREAQKAQEGRFRNVDRLTKAMQRLVAMDVVREQKRHNRRAPPTVVYTVNPKCLST
jgi:putative DNA primase/helicase